MSIKIGFMCLLTTFVLAGCSQQGTSPPQQLKIEVPASMSKDQGLVLKSAWQKVLASCPGFSKYTSEMTFEGIQDNFAYATDDAKRIEVMFRVGDHSKIPPEYAVSGHVCYFSITPDGRKLVISKSGCASLCADKRTDEKGSYELPL